MKNYYSQSAIRKSYSQFSVKKIPNIRYHGNKGSVGENLTYVVKLADLENPPTTCKNQGRIFYLSQLIASFRLKIPNFRYHGNRGSVWENLTYVIKLADLENPLLRARTKGRIFYLSRVMANFVLK